MAKKNQSADGVEITPRQPVKIEDFQLPEGFTQVNLDIVGFWNEDCVLQCVPQDVKIFDNKVESIKSSALITAKVVEPLEVRTTDGELVKADVGMLIGIWGRPGLRELKVYGNCHVIIVPDGAIEIGKPNPMRAFKIYSNANNDAKPLPVALDKREKSKNTESLWAETAA